MKRPHQSSAASEPPPPKRQITLRVLLSRISSTPAPVPDVHATTPAPVPDVVATTPAPAPDVETPQDNKTLAELKMISRQDALLAWERLRDGYRDKSGSGYAAATREENGCIIANKQANRADNGYVQIAPIVTTRTRALKGHARKQKPCPQSGHRLAVIAFHDQTAIDHMLDDAWHASHLCHRPRCIEPSHIVVEPKRANEARKACKDKVSTIPTQHLFLQLQRLTLM
jgi:hypothetical protein